MEQATLGGSEPFREWPRGAAPPRSRGLRSADDADEARILVLLNVDDRPYRFPIDVGSLTVAATPEPEPRTPPEPALVPAHSWTILAPAGP